MKTWSTGTFHAGFTKGFIVKEAKEKYREREPKKKHPNRSKDFGTRERSQVRFLLTGLFGELEHRQGLRAIKRVLRG